MKYTILLKHLCENIVFISNHYSVSKIYDSQAKHFSDSCMDLYYFLYSQICLLWHSKGTL